MLTIHRGSIHVLWAFILSLFCFRWGRVMFRYFLSSSLSLRIWWPVVIAYYPLLSSVYHLKLTALVPQIQISCFHLCKLPNRMNKYHTICKLFKWTPEIKEWKLGRALDLSPCCSSPCNLIRAISNNEVRSSPSGSADSGLSIKWNKAS